ncbi:MAG: hypothetical protein ACREJM_14485, partial [Candidatus Saccharimonadales bacterium]
MFRRFRILAVAWWWSTALCWQAGADEQAGADNQAGAGVQVAPAQPAESSRAAAIFKQLDANGDGQIAEDETPAGRRQLFKRLLRRADSNGDGKLSEAEFIAGMNEDRPDPPAESPAGGGDQYARFLAADSGAVFKRLDANGDGKIERSELPEPVRARFEPFLENFDVNRDK